MGEKSGAQKRKKVKKAPGGDVESGEIPPVGEKSGAQKRKIDEYAPERGKETSKICPYICSRAIIDER